MKVCIITDKACSEHLTGRGHPERPERIAFINRALEAAGLKTDKNTLSARLATPEEIALCHDNNYYQKVATEVRNLSGSHLAQLSTGDVIISPKSLHAARLSAGGAMVAVDQVLTKQTLKAFCVLRPPGHHAGRTRGAGFCIFNNVAIAARYAQLKYEIKRVLIVDWDVHHGDGTQDIFYRDHSVFYFSTHEEGNYPHTGEVDEIGEGEGKGFTMNVPIPGKILNGSRKGTGAKVIEAVRTKLTTAMKDFQPELIFISCGFDGHLEDPLGGFDLTDTDYATLTKDVIAIAANYAQGRIISVLEGGYNLNAIAAASVAHVKALMD